MKRILISGFEPFGDLKTNPTMELIERLNSKSIPNLEINTIILPVVYNQCAAELIEYINEIKPDLVLSLGVAVGRSAITPERIAINIQDTVGEGKSGDNHGDMPTDRPVERSGPDGLFSTLPIREMVQLLSNNGIPAQISNTAGTYICNNTMYSVLLHLKNNFPEMKAGFVHVPATPEMVLKKPSIPSMDITVQERAMELILEYLSQSEN
ncbi:MULTISPECIES: pyroglutamyl-peptidase I [Bacillaceae]|uniref:Pyrrolidone-carboxylate peptidase n=1 Tax=Evansella alkalicola TaxID=745819 RepID=A0ABS6JTN8_9BACI|nr:MULTISPECIES: pyroglutamyl-peptidase I [Bacillaceae]MBU9721863.1 pyroglutamyl-peptidase I [Bacillus alkalicola]